MARTHRTAELRSIAMHRLVAERLRRDPQLIDDALERIDELLRREALHPAYAQRWHELLRNPVGEVADALTADTEEMRALRQSSPFAGVLTEDERLRVFREVGE